MKKNPPIKIEYHSGKAPVAKKDIKASRKLKVITDPEAQRKHPGKITKIPSGNITMKGIPYPVLGIDNLGNQILMMPDQDYAFPGDEVTEYPMMQIGGEEPFITQRDTIYDPKMLAKFPLRNGKGPKYLLQDKSTNYIKKEKEKGVLDYVDDIMSAPQRAAVYALTGKYENPSKALGINEEEHPWLAMGTDMILDPTNLLGIGLAKSLSKAGKVTEVITKAPTVKKLETIKDLKTIYKNPDLYKYADSYKNISKNDFWKQYDDIINNLPAESFIRTMPVEEARKTVMELSKTGAGIAILNDLIHQKGEYESKNSYKITPVYDDPIYDDPIADNKTDMTKTSKTLNVKKQLKSVSVPPIPIKRAIANYGQDNPPWKEKGAISFEPNTTNLSGGKGQYVYYDINGYPKIITKDEYDRQNKLGTPKFQKGGTKPIIVNDPNDPRLKAYQDSLDLFKMSSKLYKGWANELPKISKDEYNRLRQKDKSLIKYDFDEAKYEEDKKNKVELKSFNDYIYSSPDSSFFDHPRYIANREYNVKNKGYWDQNKSKQNNDDKHDIILKNGDIKRPLTLYDGKPDWTDYLVFSSNGVTRSYTKDFDGGSDLQSIHSPNIKPIRTEYYGEDKLTPLNKITTSSVSTTQKGKEKPKFVDKSNNEYQNNMIRTSEFDVYKKPVQPYVYQKPIKVREQVIPRSLRNDSEAKPVINKAQANVRYEQPPIFEITMPTGDKISKKDFVKQYGEAAWNRATGKFQDGGEAKRSFRKTSKPYTTYKPEVINSGPLKESSIVDNEFVENEGVYDLPKHVLDNYLNALRNPNRSTGEKLSEKFNFPLRGDTAPQYVKEILGAKESYTPEEIEIINESRKVQYSKQNYIDKYQDGGSFNLSKPSLKGIKDNIENTVIPYGINPYTSKPFATGAIEESMSPLDLIGGIKGLVTSGKGIIDLAKAMKSNPVNIGNATFELGKHPKSIERAMKKINSGVIEIVKPNSFQDGGQNNAAYPIPKKFVAEFNKQQAAAEEYTRKSTGKTLKERQSARGINPYTSKPFATGEAEYFPIESAILPGTPMVKGIGKVANLALDAMNPMAGMRSPGQYYDDVTRQALDRSFMSKASMKNKLDQIGKFYEDPRNEGKFFYTDRMSATDEAFNYAKNYDKEMTMEQIEKLATESPEAFSPYYNDRLKKYYSGEYGEDAVPIFEGRFNQRQPDSNIQGDYFDLTRTGYTDIPSFNQQVNDLKIRAVHGDLTKKHKLGKSATKDLAEQRAMDPDGGIELYNQGRLLDDSMDPNKLKKFRAIDAYQGLQPNKLGGQFEYKGPIANFLQKGGQPTYAEFLDYGHATGPMMFEHGGSTSCDTKFEQGRSTTDNVIATKRDNLLKFLKKNTIKALDKEVRTDIAQMGVDHWDAFLPQVPQYDANQMFGVNPIQMDPNQMSKQFVTSQPQPTDYRRSNNAFGEPGVNAVLTGINAVTMGLEERERKMNEKNNSYRTTPDYFSPVTSPFLGDWETNKEVLRPNKMVGAQYQGFKEGGEVYLTQEEINDLLANGGQIEYLD